MLDGRKGPKCAGICDDLHPLLVARRAERHALNRGDMQTMRRTQSVYNEALEGTESRRLWQVPAHITH